MAKNRMSGIENIKNKNSNKIENQNSSDSQEIIDLKTRELELQTLKRDLDTKEREIKNKINALEKKEISLNEKDTILKTKEIELQNFKRDLDIKERESKNKNSELQKKEVFLLDRENEILARETAAENGFLKQKDKVKIFQEEQRKELENEILRQRDILEKVEIEISKLREEKLEDLSYEIRDMIQKEKKKLLDQERMIQEDWERVEIEREKYISLQKSFLDKQKELNYEFELLEEEKQRLDETVERKIFKEKREAESMISKKNQMIEFYENANNSLKEELKYYLDLELKSGGKSTNELVRELQSLIDENKQLREKIANIPSSIDWDEIEQLKSGKTKLEKQYKLLAEAYNNLKQQETRWIITNGEMQNLETKKNITERRLEAVLAQVEHYAKEVNSLKLLHHKPQEKQARVGVIEEPYFVAKNSFMDYYTTELEWLEMIYESCKNSGFVFSKRLLYAFHTALKTSEWSPLTVLAGVSGTGKSELPNLYSRFGGLVYLPLPVQPDWDSPQSLFGFFNSVDNRFNATTLLRTLVQAQKDLSDNVILILLDEMNLAHVELYFSELLSKLETRRSSPVKLEIDLGAGLEKYHVSLEKNVLWIGTMNEDETTKTLSDKVIDRGNLITFPRPTEFVSRRTIIPLPESESLHRKTWNHWIEKKADFGLEINTYKEVLEEINKNLEKVGRALGHRVWQSVENYMASHPLVIDAHTSEDKEKYKKYLENAYEDALVHKVMPKLRGIETTGKSKKSLEEIGELIRQYAPGLSEDFKYAISLPYGVFIWSSSKYLEADYE